MVNTEYSSLDTGLFEPKDLRIIMMRYVRYWYLLLISIILGLCGAFLFINYYAIPQYKVYSTILIKDDKNGQGFSNGDALNDLSTFKSTRNIDNEIEILKSKSLMDRVIKELNMYAKFYIRGKVKDTEIYGNSSPVKILMGNIDSTAAGKSFTLSFNSSGSSFKLDDYNGKPMSYNFGQQITKPYGTFTIVASTNKIATAGNIFVQFQDVKQVANYYNQAIVIQPISKSTSVLTISLIDPIPERAKNVINKLMDVYNKEGIEDKSLMTANTLKFLDERLKILTAELLGVEKNVEKYKSVNGVTDISIQASDYTTQASTYDKQLSEWAIQIDVLESIDKYLRNTAGQYSTVPSTLGIKDETLLGLIGNFNTLQVERERMLRTIQPNSILIVNINEQLANLRNNILENLRNIKQGLQITSNKLRASSGQFQSKIRKVPVIERELQNINRPQEIKHNIYAYLLQKREETALSLAATASIARIIDPAMGGEYPISPNGQSIYLMSLLLGIGLPIICIYGLNLLNNKVQVQQDVSSIISAPIIGEIAHKNKQDNIIVTQNAGSPITEMFRLIRANLGFIAIDKKNVVLLITSSMSGEGKTFCSINLSASLALTNKRVILVDLDLRNSKIAKNLKLHNEAGVTDYLLDNTIAISDIIKHSDEIPNLSIITSGPLPPNPAELLLSAKFIHLMAELKNDFDYIILDTPPVGQVADAFTLNSFVDFTIYIVRYNYTYKAQLDIIKNICRNQNLNHPLVLLNDAKEVNESGYGYGYGYGYAQDAKRNKINV